MFCTYFDCCIYDLITLLLPGMLQNIFFDDIDRKESINLFTVFIVLIKLFIIIILNSVIRLSLRILSAVYYTSHLFNL